MKSKDISEIKKEIIICSENDSDDVLIEMKELSTIPSAMRGLEKQETSSLNDLTSLLSLLPNTLASNEVGKSCYYQVIANGDLVKAKNIEGGYRAFVRGNKGIEEQAILFKPDKLSKVVNFAAVFSAVSLAVGQKHLSDISKYLENINNSLTEIKDFQKDERASNIIYWHEQMSIVYKCLQSKYSEKILSDKLNMMKDCENVLGPIQEHLKKDVKKQLESLTIDNIDKLERLVLEWIACFETRAKIFLIKKLFGIEDVDDRLKLIKNKLEEFITLMSSDYLISKEINERDVSRKIKRFLNFDQSPESKKLAIAIADKNSLIKELSRKIEPTDRIVNLNPKLIEVVLEVESGKVISAYY